jgi:hypothetical protein
MLKTVGTTVQNSVALTLCTSDLTVTGTVLMLTELPFWLRAFSGHAKDLYYKWQWIVLDEKHFDWLDLRSLNPEWLGYVGQRLLRP